MNSAIDDFSFKIKYVKNSFKMCKDWEPVFFKEIFGNDYKMSLFEIEFLQYILNIYTERWYNKY